MYSSRPDLQDEPLSDAEVEVFTDGNSCMLEGKQRAGVLGLAEMNLILPIAAP